MVFLKEKKYRGTSRETDNWTLHVHVVPVDIVAGESKGIWHR